ncbi:MAG: hypothetical protein WA733_05130 [Methylocystis sp.]|jgi:hypothetical protein
MRLCFKELPVWRAAALPLYLGFVLLASADVRADTPAWCERYDNQPPAKIESLPGELRGEARMLVDEAEDAARHQGVDAKAKLFRLPRIDKKIDLAPGVWMLAAFVSKPDGNIASLFLYSATSKQKFTLGDLPPWFEAELSEPQEGDGKQFGALTYIFFDGGRYRIDFTVASTTELDAAGSPSGPTAYSSWFEAKAGSEKLASFCSLQQRHRAPF